jgi:hypothetical protein
VFRNKIGLMIIVLPPPGLPHEDGGGRILFEIDIRN